MFKLGKFISWCATGVDLSSPLISRLHQWPTRWIEMECSHICRWYVLISVVLDPHSSSDVLNFDLTLNKSCVHQWRMFSNSDKSKQAVQLIFSRWRLSLNNPQIYFNYIQVLIMMSVNTSVSSLVKSLLSPLLISPSFVFKWKWWD